MVQGKILNGFEQQGKKKHPGISLGSFFIKSAKRPKIEGYVLQKESVRKTKKFPLTFNKFAALESLEWDLQTKLKNTTAARYFITWQARAKLESGFSPHFSLCL